MFKARRDRARRYLKRAGYDDGGAVVDVATDEPAAEVSRPINNVTDAGNDRSFVADLSAIKRKKSQLMDADTPSPSRAPAAVVGGRG